MKEKSIIGYVFEVLFESRTCEIAMLYPTDNWDYWVCLWIPKVNIVPTQKWRVSRGGARFLCVSRRAPRWGVHPKMDHMKVYLTEVHLDMGSDL